MDTQGNCITYYTYVYKCDVCMCLKEYEGVCKGQSFMLDIFFHDWTLFICFLIQLLYYYCYMYKMLTRLKL